MLKDTGEKSILHYIFRNVIFHMGSFVTGIVGSKFPLKRPLCVGGRPRHRTRSVRSCLEETVAGDGEGINYWVD